MPRTISSEDDCRSNAQLRNNAIQTATQVSHMMQIFPALADGCDLLKIHGRRLNFALIEPSAVRTRKIYRPRAEPGGFFIPPDAVMSTAIFVDAGFFLKRFRHVYAGRDNKDPVLAAKVLHEMCLGHLTQRGDAERRELYRIFVYDCPPLAKKAHTPIGKAAIDFSKSSTAVFRLAFHSELKRLRKVALRLGRLQDGNGWIVKPAALTAVLKGERSVEELTDRDFDYDVRQKGTDMKIGIDIASVAYKKQVDQIVLVAGDADFVPAAKLARREGIDFILDPMWKSIAPDLHEHIDGLRSTCPKPAGPDTAGLAAGMGSR